MFALLFATFVAAVLLLSLRIPSVWLSLIAHDEPMDAHELGLALVATRMSATFLHFIPIIYRRRLLRESFPGKRAPRLHGEAHNVTTQGMSNSLFSPSRHGRNSTPIPKPFIFPNTRPILTLSCPFAWPTAQPGDCSQTSSIQLCCSSVTTSSRTAARTATAAISNAMDSCPCEELWEATSLTIQTHPVMPD